MGDLVYVVQLLLPFYNSFLNKVNNKILFDLQDDKYWENRIKNNIAARR